MSDVTCRACGVALPGWVALCPACGARSVRRRPPAWVGLAVAACLALAVLGLTRRPRVDPALGAVVKSYTALIRPSKDFRRTEVSGFIENKAQVPVDVTVRVRAYGVRDHLMADFESGPYRNLAPDSSKPIQVILDMIPVDKVEIDVVELAPTPR